MKNELLDQNLPAVQSQTAPQTVVVASKQQRVWNSIGEKEKRLYASLIAAGVTVTIVGFAVWLTYRKLKQIRADHAQSRSFGDNKHDTWAKQFQQAFDNDGWWGTDVAMVRRTLKAIPSKDDFKTVSEKYSVLTQGRNLITDMTDELTKTEYEEMLAIKNALPQTSKTGSAAKIYDPYGWAKRIHAAVNYTWFGFLPGTDEEAIEEVFSEIPSQKAFYQMAGVYKKLYHTSVWTDLDGDTDFSLDWRALLKKKAKQ